MRVCAFSFRYGFWLRILGPYSDIGVLLAGDLKMFLQPCYIAVVYGAEFGFLRA